MQTEKDLLQMAKFSHNGQNGERYYFADDAFFAETIKGAWESKLTLVALFCEENQHAFTLFYVFEKTGDDGLIVLKKNIIGKKSQSIMSVFPSASWYEREIMDGFGIDFEGSKDTRRLVLHEVYPQTFHPLLKSFQNKKIILKDRSPEYEFKKVDGIGLYQIPVGPVHAGIIEPGHFRFSVIGERIYNLELRLFYKHRGIEKLAEAKAADECVTVAESISGDCSVANSVAFCMAAESIFATIVPARALHLRGVFLELERIYSHLGDLAGMIIDVAFPVGAAPFFMLREEILRMNERLTSSRFMKGAIRIGGVKSDVKKDELDQFASYLRQFSSRFSKAVDEVLSSPSVVDRLETTGVIKSFLIQPLNITGPAARASGSMKDTRKDHPYGIYKTFPVSVKTRNEGDVLARFLVKVDEIGESAKYVQGLIAKMPSGKIREMPVPKDGVSLQLVESARGQNLHWLDIREGKIYRYKVRTASFCNWQAIEHAVLGNIVPDFPLINKSLNLSYAGTDL